MLAPVQVLCQLDKSLAVKMSPLAIRGKATGVRASPVKVVQFAIPVEIVRVGVLELILQISRAGIQDVAHGRQRACREDRY